MAEPTRELIDAIFRDKVRAARAMSPEEKLRAGPRMFEEACDEIRGCIRTSFPLATPDDVNILLRTVVNFAERRDII